MYVLFTSAYKAAVNSVFLFCFCPGANEKIQLGTCESPGTKPSKMLPREENMGRVSLHKVNWLESMKRCIKGLLGIFPRHFFFNICSKWCNIGYSARNLPGARNSFARCQASLPGAKWQIWHLLPILETLQSFLHGN